MTRAQQRIIAALRWRVTLARRQARVRYVERQAAKPEPSPPVFISYPKGSLISAGPPIERLIAIEMQEFAVELKHPDIVRCVKCWVGFNIATAAMRAAAVEHMRRKHRPTES